MWGVCEPRTCPTPASVSTVWSSTTRRARRRMSPQSHLSRKANAYPEGGQQVAVRGGGERRGGVFCYAEGAADAPA